MMSHAGKASHKISRVSLGRKWPPCEPGVTSLYQGYPSMAWKGLNTHFQECFSFNKPVTPNTCYPQTSTLQERLFTWLKVTSCDLESLHMTQKWCHCTRSASTGHAKVWILVFWVHFTSYKPVTAGKDSHNPGGDITWPEVTSHIE